MNNLLLVTLSDEQIDNAKAVNGARKRITHVLLCGEYGQIFGTEKHCLKYYTAWEKIFKDLFDESKVLESHEVLNYESTFNLVNVLSEALDKIQYQDLEELIEPVSKPKKEKKGLWARIFG
ncbi:hypothetical protein J7I07_004368 [Vibrio vulnificus]|nr:hypothetical protein [Vibrio vulnificus]EHI9302812.1 hypothetical protein [Vibrio vulnificus]